MPTYIPMRVRAKLALRKALPQPLFNAVSAVWRGTAAHFVGDQAILTKYREAFLATHPRIVQEGPFKGMHYVDSAIGSSYLHKLVGCYESVLHSYILSIKDKDFDTILDIGSAEGYYLAGFGSMFPKATLIGFEIEEKGRELTKELCEINEVKNELKLFGEATKDNVAPLITENTLLICDCEGGEMDILDPVARPEFKKVAAAIIELHDFLRPGIEETLTERFKDTHDITLVPFELADPDSYPFFAAIEDKRERYEVLRERGWQEQKWMILKRKR